MPNSCALGTNATDDELRVFDSQAAEYYNATQKMITNGYTYSVVQKNGGGINVGYDVQAKRAFVVTTPR